MFKNIIIILFLTCSTTFFCTFEDVDRATSILNLDSPTVDMTFYGT